MATIFKSETREATPSWEAVLRKVQRNLPGFAA